MRNKLVQISIFHFGKTRMFNIFFHFKISEIKSVYLRLFLRTNGER
jgi:hypothetical protein